MDVIVLLMIGASSGEKLLETVPFSFGGGGGHTNCLSLGGQRGIRKRQGGEKNPKVHVYSG